MDAGSVPQRFPILFTGGNKSLAIIGIRPSTSYVALTPDRLTVRMSMVFRTTFSRSSIAWAAPDDGPVGGWGVHGWHGRWLVNGSSKQLVRLKLAPPVRARMIGLPITVTQLRISMEDRDGFLAALAVPLPPEDDEEAHRRRRH